MHISCPKCNKTINVKNYNLFQIWDCPDCEWRFRGVHAGQPVFLNYLYEFTSPLYHGEHITDLAGCPMCGTTIKLNWIYSTTPGRNFGPFRRKGYNGPYFCFNCRNPLPWDYPLQKPHIAKAHNEWVDEHNQKHGFTENKESRQDEGISSRYTQEEKTRLSNLAAQLYKKKHNL